MKTKILLIILGCTISTTLNSQILFNLFRKVEINRLVKKQGVYVGYERGIYDVFEVGSDNQRKRVIGKKVTINGITSGLQYNLRENIGCYNIGYYRQKSHVGMTYGFEISGVTNFKEIQPTFSPLIGFKISGFHIQSGYKFIYPVLSDISSNTFFFRIRFTINQHTEWKLIRDYNEPKKKGKKKKK